MRIDHEKITINVLLAIQAGELVTEAVNILFAMQERYKNLFY